ncbi:MAG TPA: S41 family peptidase [Ktedonobacteraceae bacterium]|nr:S41 family peptidase [Ktedonobacteraceae bacterium]
MNDSDKTISETLNDDQKVNANKESTRRSSSDFEALTSGEFSRDVSHRSKYGRLSVSNYDDPRWYEQQENRFAPESSDQFNPTSTAYIPAALQQISSKEPEPDLKHRFGRIFGQVIVTLTLMIIAFLGGWFGHQLYTNASFNASDQSKSYANLFQQAWKMVDQNYVDRKAINYKEMSYQAIRAMLGVLHDTGHTRFLTPQDVKSEKQQLSGKLIGIGINLQQDAKTKQIIISATIPGTPAEKAGIKRGDIIVAVNGTNVVGKDINSVIPLIKGSIGTNVTLTVVRPSTNQRLTFTMKRAEIQVPSVVSYYIAQDHIAHIQITQFSEGVSDQLRSALNKAKQEGARSIILDLRDDPGGYLQEAINVTSEFIGKGNVLLEQDSSGTRTPQPVTGHPLDTTIPIVVLTNGNTASAAEIVSGALKDDNRAIVLGVKTFGTGTVLDEFDLSDGSAILLGTSEWLTPKGQFIRDRGIQPNIEVNLSSNISPVTPSTESQGHFTLQQILNSGDTQLVGAIRYLETH